MVALHTGTQLYFSKTYLTYHPISLNVTVMVAIKTKNFSFETTFT